MVRKGSAVQIRLEAPESAFILGFGPLVKRLRHRPFTAVTRVRIPYGSPFITNKSVSAGLAYKRLFESCTVSHFKTNIYVYGGLAQLGEHLPYKQRVGGSNPSSSTIQITFTYAGVAQLVEQLTCNQ